MEADTNAGRELLVTLETTQRATNLTLSADGLHVVSIETGQLSTAPMFGLRS